MEELTSEQLAKLAKTAEDGDVILSWLQHPGFKIFRSWIESKIEDRKYAWLRCPSPIEAESIRVKASVYSEVLDEMKKYVISGVNAKKLIAENTVVEEDSNEPPSLDGQG